MKKTPIAIWLILLATVQMACGQTLDAVLRAVQQRRLAVEQLTIVTHPDPWPAPPMSLIDWHISGDAQAPMLPPFPSASQIEAAGLTFAQKIYLLRLASEHFSELRPQYMNLDRASGNNTLSSTPAQFRTFTYDDLPDPPIPNQDNYHSVLAILAQRVRCLKQLPWRCQAIGPSAVQSDVSFQLEWDNQYLGGAILKLPPPFRSDTSNVNFGVQPGFGAGNQLFTSRATRYHPDIPWAVLMGYEHKQKQGEPFIFKSVHHHPPPPEVPDHDSTYIVDPTVGPFRTQYATRLTIHTQPDFPPPASGGFQWLDLNFKAWAGDDWFPSNVTPHTMLKRGWKAVQLASGSSASGPNTVFGEPGDPPSTALSTPWALSDDLGLASPADLSIAGTWSASGESTSAMTIMGFVPGHPQFKIARILVLIAEPEFDDEDLLVPDARWNSIASSPGSFRMAIEHPLLEIDLGVGIGPAAGTGRLIVALHESNSLLDPLGFGGPKFVGPRSDFIFEYQEPPTQLAYNSSAAATAGWGSYENYASAWDNLRLKKVRGSQLEVEVSFAGGHDYRYTLTFRPIANGNPGAPFRTLTISNPTASASSFPTHKGSLRVVEAAGVSGNARQWDFSLAQNNTHSLTLRPEGASAEDYEEKYVPISQFRTDTGAPHSNGFRHTIHQRRHVLGSENSLKLVYDADVSYSTGGILMPPLPAERIVERIDAHPVTGNYPVRRIDNTYSQFQSVINDHGFHSITYPPNVITQTKSKEILISQSPGWELHNAQWDYDNNGRLTQFTRSFNTAKNLATVRSTSEAPGYHFLIDKTDLRNKGAIVEGDIFKIETVKYATTLDSYEVWVNGSSGDADKILDVVLSPGGANGSPNWVPVLVTEADGFQTGHAYLLVDNLPHMVSYRGAWGLSQGMAEVRKFNGSGKLLASYGRNCITPFSSTALPTGATMFSCTSSGGTDAFGQPLQYTQLDGGVVNLTTHPTGSWAGQVHTVKGPDNITRTINERDIHGNVVKSGSSTGITESLLYDQLTRAVKIQFGVTGPSRIVTTATDAFGTLLRQSSNQGTGFSYQATGIGVGTLTTETAAGGNRSRTVNRANDGSAASITAGAGSRAASGSRSFADWEGLLRLVVTETVGGSGGPVTKTYYDHRDRVVRIERPNPNGTAIPVATHFYYPSESISHYTSPTGTYPGRVMMVSPDRQTVQVRKYAPGLPLEFRLIQLWEGDGLVWKKEIDDDSAGGADVTTTVAFTKHIPSLRKTTVNTTWGAPATKSSSELHYPGLPPDIKMRVNTTGLYGYSSQEEYTDSRLSNVTRSGLPDGKTATLQIGRDSLLEPATFQLNLPSLSGFSGGFNGQGRLSHVLGPGLSTYTDYTYPAGRERTTITNDYTPQTTVHEKDAQGFPSRVQAFGEDDGNLTTTPTGLKLDTTLTPDGGSSVTYKTGPRGHLLERNFASGSGYSVTCNDDGSIASFRVPNPAGGGTRECTLVHDPYDRTISSSWQNETYSSSQAYYKIGLPKTISNPHDSVTLKWLKGQLHTEQHTAGSAGLTGYKVERLYTPEGPEGQEGLYAGVKIHHGSNVLCTTEFFRDSFGRVLNVTSSAAGSSSTLAAGSPSTYSYMPGTSVVHMFRRNGVVTTNTPSHTGRLRIGSSITNGSGVETFSHSYFYNLAGLIFERNGSHIPNLYHGYTSDGRLESTSDGVSWTTPYEFQANWDLMGNPGGGANSLNQLTSRTNSQECHVSGKVATGSTVRLWANATLYPDPAHAVPLAVSPGGSFQANWSIPPASTWRSVPVVVEGRKAGAGTNGTDAVAIARYALVVPPQTTTFPHDGAGNRAGDAKHAYTWDPRGRMTTLSRNSSYAAVSGGPVNVTCVCDARGRRIMKTVQDTVLVGAVTTNRTTVTRWVYDGWLPVVEETQIDAGPIKRKFFVWGLDLSQTVGGAGGIGGLIAIHDVADNPSNSKTYLPVTDGLGNIVALLDSATKATLAKWTYDAWGNTVSSEGNTALCPFGWQSKYRDPESGLIYFGYRYYDPPTRRWLSRDPLGEAGSFNPYSYCREDPVNNIDPDGLDKVAVQSHMTEAQDLLTSICQALASLPEMEEDDLLSSVEAIESSYQSYLGSLEMGRNELKSFIDEGWFMSWRGVDEKLAAELGTFPLLVAGMAPGEGTLRHLMCLDTGLSSTFDTQIVALERTCTALSVTETTSSGILLASGVGGLGVATGRVIASQGLKAGAAFLARQGAIAGGVMAGGYSAQELLVAAGISPETASAAMKGAELFFALRALKLARMTPAAKTPASFFGNTRLEVQALQRQGLSRSEAFAQIRSFNAGNADGYLFHFTNQTGGRGIVGSGEILATQRGLGGAGVYTGTTPTPNFFQRYFSPVGWGVNPGANVRIPLRATPEIESITRTPFLPRWTRIVGEGQSIPLPTP